MNILLSAYSCNPYHGSEDGIGWQWAVQLNRNWKNGDRIVMITKQFNEADMKRGLKEFNLEHIELIIVDVPKCLNWFREKHSAFHHMYYHLWQETAYRWVKKSGIKFDVIHHVTMGDFRITGKMYKFKDSYTIFGPVGGGQITPKALKCYEGSKLSYIIREFVNLTRAVSPLYKSKIKKFSKIYAVNTETQNIISKAASAPCEKLLEMALPDEYKNLPQNIRNNQTVKVVFVGRLIHKKGIMFLADVIKEIPDDINFELSVYGNGPLMEEMQDTVKKYNLENKIFCKGAVAHSQISNVYAQSDIFVLPSLRETSGNVLLEAMANQLPIVALDMSVCSDLKKENCGLFVNTEQSKEEIITEFSSKLTQLILSSEKRQELGKNGYEYVNTLTWEDKYKYVYNNIGK